MLNELERELERRGHRFVRYADYCNIYVKSLRAGERIMKGISEFIEKKLKVKVDEVKRAVGKSKAWIFLGVSMEKRHYPQRILAFFIKPYNQSCPK
jgi:RNA-directed DNA polymerase